MKGQIVKIVSNLYTVNCKGNIYECHSRGKFRNEKITPVVGDYVVIDEKNKYILEVENRKNRLTTEEAAETLLKEVVDMENYYKRLMGEVFYSILTAVLIAGKE